METYMCGVDAETGLVANRVTNRCASWASLMMPSEPAMA
jgi:hypothetical protein